MSLCLHVGDTAQVKRLTDDMHTIKSVETNQMRVIGTLPHTYRYGKSNERYAMGLEARKKPLVLVITHPCEGCHGICHVPP